MTMIQETPTVQAGLITDLQRVLIDLVALHVTLKQVHWTVRGPGFRSLHLAVDDVVTEARNHSDTIAERIRALRGVPDGRIGTAAATSRLPEFPLGEIDTAAAIGFVVDLLQRVTAVVRDVHDAVDDADPTSADLLHVVIEGLERHAWLISAEIPG